MCLLASTDTSTGRNPRLGLENLGLAAEEPSCPHPPTLPQVVMLYIIIVHPDHRGILVNESGCLPLYHWEDECSFYSDSYQACELMKGKLKASFDLNFLRYEAATSDDDQPSVALLEIPFDRSPNAPLTYKWILPKDVEKITVSPSNETVTSFLVLYKTLKLRINEQRLRPYSKEGWFASACEWVRDRVENLTKLKVVEIVKIKTALNACVLRAKTSNGSRFFMKSVMKEPHDEVQVTSAIHGVMRDRFGDILSVDEDRRFMLLRDCGTPMVRKDCYLSCNGDVARDVMRQWVDMQKKSVTLVEELCHAGVRRRGGVELQAELELVASDKNWFKAQLAGLKRDGVTQDFSHAEYKALLLSHVADDLQTVEKLKLPLCLVHGDLLPVNVVRQSNGVFTFFDFEGSIVSYPFLDALYFLYHCNEYQDLLFNDISFYLSLWGVMVPEDEADSVLNAMNNIQRYVGEIFQIKTWRDAEEYARNFFFDEMKAPVYHLFK